MTVFMVVAGMVMFVFGFIAVPDEFRWVILFFNGLVLVVGAGVVACLDVFGEVRKLRSGKE